MSQIPLHYKKRRKAHLHFVPFELEKRGHNIDLIERKQWIYFYLKYLKFRPDILIVSGLVGFFPMFLKKLGLIRKPVVYYWGDYFHEAMGRRWGLAKCAFMEFFCAQNASFITTPSIFLKNVCDTLSLKNTYIPHGVIWGVKKIKASSLPQLSKNQKNLIKFIYVGDINQYKRVDRVIEAVRDKECILYLIGRCLNKDVIKNLPKNCVYMEEISHRKVLSYARACDVAVITADQDSTLKMFEYLALGKTILAFNGRINYVLRHKENAYMASNFSDAVEELIKNKKIRNKLSKNAKKFKIYTWREIARKYEALFKKLVYKK